jgi:hypothetical protein
MKEFARSYVEFLKQISIELALDVPLHSFSQTIRAAEQSYAIHLGKRRPCTDMVQDLFAPLSVIPSLQILIYFLLF